MTTQIADYAVLAMQAYDFMDEDDTRYSDEARKNTFSLDSEEGFSGWKAQHGLDADFTASTALPIQLELGFRIGFAPWMGTFFPERMPAIGACP